MIPKALLTLTPRPVPSPSLWGGHPQACGGALPSPSQGWLPRRPSPGSSELLPADLAASICCPGNLLRYQGPPLGRHWSSWSYLNMESGLDMSIVLM